LAKYVAGERIDLESSRYSPDIDYYAIESTTSEDDATTIHFEDSVTTSVIIESRIDTGRLERLRINRFKICDLDVMIRSLKKRVS
jgi:hypothetical protein